MIGKLQRIHNFTLFAAAPRVPPPVNQLWMIACATNHGLRCLIERVSVRFSKVALEDVKVVIGSSVGWWAHLPITPELFRLQACFPRNIILLKTKPLVAKMRQDEPFVKQGTRIWTSAEKV